ncbi:Undecaprenyl-phosphate mannosyltransferase [Fervidicola ferrireducens]|uniref:Undecaprenyl-phosphate mannosyltransferase n=1 Tax=Fervidicola ferrireducens TaxID=520764 RepID=A0A140L0V0_9FIRM|nr:glycosyltransferase [Fervidicola ferrireducens]KXG74175.1 Undecaprenyl-phosphate mannosyltransferase [Fervidicola ferrireducens]
MRRNSVKNDVSKTEGLIVIVPAYNEEARLKRLFDKWQDILNQYKCILVDDGSSDGTFLLAKTMNFLDVLKHERNLGKGAAVRTGILYAINRYNAKAVLFADADLSAGPKAWDVVAQGLQEADVAVGSRFACGAKVKRSKLRSVSSLAFHYLQKICLHLPVLDTQCGCKAFTRETAIKLFNPELRFPGFEFDLEILLRAVAQGLRIKEIGIEWHEERGSKVHITRDAIKLTRAVFVCQRELFGLQNAKEMPQ